MRTVRCSGNPWGGECLPAGGVCLGVYLPMGDLPAGDVCLLGGLSAQGVSASPPAVDRMTSTCKYITLPQLRCGW